jgi:hypothetical protein
LAGWFVAPKSEAFGVVVEVPKREEPKPEVGWAWVGVVVVFPNREPPCVVVVWPKILLPALGVATAVEPPKLPEPRVPVDAAVAGVPRPMKNDMVGIEGGCHFERLWLKLQIQHS